MRTIRLLAVLAIASALFAVAAPASASTPARTLVAQAINTLANQQSDNCLDDSFAYGVRTYPCNGQNFQQWEVKTWSDGTREFKNVNTKRCIGSDLDGSVWVGECSTSRTVSWYVKWWSDGTFELRNQAWGDCLEETVWLHTDGCDASREQSWY
jgi:hypothetical protein